MIDTEHSRGAARAPGGDNSSCPLARAEAEYERALEQLRAATRELRERTAIRRARFNDAA